MNRVLGKSFMLILGLTLVHQAQGANENDPRSNNANRDEFASMRQECVDTINNYRATLNLPPLERWFEGESCADDEARANTESGQPHDANICGWWAQNSCPGWAKDNVVSDCLASMWAEGPSPTESCEGDCYAQHGHYINMTNPSYTKVSCGFHTMPDGNVWANYDFK